jgi:CheY-like chemotaxis protein
MNNIGHEYAVAENGEQVIDLLKNQCFDVVLMDLEMPVMNGVEAMKRIRSGDAGNDNINIIIHAMSAHVMQTTIEKCLKEGFNGYITKPVDLKKLAGIL